MVKVVHIMLKEKLERFRIREQAKKIIKVEMHAKTDEERMNKYIERERKRTIKRKMQNKEKNTEICIIHV